MQIRDDDTRIGGVDGDGTVVRRLRPGEEVAFQRSVRIPFLHPASGDPETEEDLRRAAAQFESGRAWVVDDDGRFAGQCSIDSLDLSLPAPLGGACPVVPMAGITAVGIHPTHRRRGLLTKMMGEMIADARDRGEAVAGLVASESSIYGRFGFGHATDRVELSLETAHSAFSFPSPPIDIRLVQPSDAVEVLGQIYERHRSRRPGEVGRSAKVWESLVADRPARRGGGHAMFVAVCEGGYVGYRSHPSPMLNPDLGRVVVEELKADTPEIEAALWRFVLDLDLVDEVVAPRRPVDEPLRWRLADPRRLKLCSSEDMLHVKVLDVPAAFQARGYQATGRIVFEVTPPPGWRDGAMPEPAFGSWSLEADVDGATCRRAGAGDEPDLVLDGAALGSVYLGGFSPSTLAGAGRVSETGPGKLQLADQLFGTRPAPLTTTGF